MLQMLQQLLSMVHLMKHLLQMLHTQMETTQKFNQMKFQEQSDSLQDLQFKLQKLLCLTIQRLMQNSKTMKLVKK